MEGPLEIALILVGVIAAYALVVVLLWRTDRLGPDRVFSLFGPALMIKTRRGRQLLERIGRFRRFWSAIGDLGILIAGITMVAIVGLLSAEAVVATRIPASEAPSPATALGLPGINPIIPVGFGIVALVVAVVLHELFHGVIARSQRIGVKSIGILWCVIPIGAFVEQDDAEMQQASRRSRDRVVAAGVLANFVLAAIFFAGSAALVTSSVTPNADGVGIVTVIDGYAAHNASIAAGDILLEVNGTATPNTDALFNALSATHPGEQVAVEYYSAAAGRTVTTEVTMASEAAYTHNASQADRGFLGVVVDAFTPQEFVTVLATPWSATGGPAIGFASWIALPLWGLEPVAGTTAGFYHATGPLSGLGISGVWFGFNLLYWLAWMNLLLGFSNALPIYPFDGGLLFRDFAATVTARLKRGWDAARVEEAARTAAGLVSVLALFLILWLFIGPRF